jgi:hypothetical protein
MIKKTCRMIANTLQWIHLKLVEHMTVIQRYTRLISTTEVLESNDQLIISGAIQFTSIIFE